MAATATASAASSRTSTSNSPTRPDGPAHRPHRPARRAPADLFTAQVKLKGLQLRAGNTVAIDNTMLGWAEKPFRVEKLRLVLGFAPSSGSGSSAQGSQQGIIGVDLELRETAEAIYDWDPAIDEQAHDPAPNTTLPDLFNVAALARWDAPTAPSDLDVRQGGFIAIRHSPATSGASWDTALSIGEALPANSMAAWLPLKTGTYLAKFIDASGNYSPTAASFVQTQSSVHTFTPVLAARRSRIPDFLGTKTNCFVIGGALQLAGGGDFDAVPDFDAIANLDYLGGATVMSATYEYDAAMDLGSVKKVRLTNTVESQVFNIFDLFDNRAADLDSWPDFDGAVSGDEADSILQVAATQDDPAGTPTWTDWQRLESATFEARGFKFRRLMTTTDPSFAIKIIADSVVAESV
jgi:hypothetical protein